MRSIHRSVLEAGLACIVSSSAFAAGCAAAPAADDETTTSSAPSALTVTGLVADGKLVHDTNNHVYWLADANAAADATLRAKVGFACDPTAGCNPSTGSMTYSNAVAWVNALNSASYLGANTWQLPTTPPDDPGCSFQPQPPPGHPNAFGWSCSESALGSLYYVGFGMSHPDTAVPIPPYTIGPVANVQPSMYWTQDTNSSGDQTFSFSNGQQGGNTQINFFYVWPMVPGAIGTPPTGSGRLVPYPDGRAVFDTVTGYTWLTDANLPASRPFGLAVNADGAMQFATTTAWLSTLNARAPEGFAQWNLPRDASDLATIYAALGLSPGQSVLTTTTTVGPFKNLQPYLYWSCQRGEYDAPNAPCGDSQPAPGYEWSFNFGSGFTGTDISDDGSANEKRLYVTVYFPEPASPCTSSGQSLLCCTEFGGFWQDGHCTGI